MHLDQRNKNSLHKLAQIKAAFCIESRKRKKCMTNILNKEGDISHQKSKSNYLKFHDKRLHEATALHLSLLNKDIELFNALLNKGCDCTLKNNNGSTVLHLAFEDYKEFSIDNPSYHQADEKKIDPFINSILSAQITNKNFTNPSNQEGLTHFHIACAVNHSKAVKFFLQKGSSEIVDQVVSDSYPRPGYTALHFAVLYCCTEAVEILLKYRANIDIKDTEGMTPLYLIVDRNVHDVPFPNQERFRRMAHLFLKESFNAKSTGDNIGLTAFHVACILGDHCLVEQLLPKVENINHAVSFESTKWPGFTALHFAMRCSIGTDNIETIKVLLKNGGDVQLKTANGMTPFDVHFTYHFKYKSEHLSEICSSIPAVKDILLSDNTTTLLEVFSIMQHPDRIDDFLQTIGENVNIFIPKTALLFPGYTLLHLAIIYSTKNSDIIKKLLDLGADVTAQDARGWTAIHLAFRSIKLQIVELLIKFHPESINPIDEENLSHLHIACYISSESAVEKLLKKNTNVNISYQGPTISNKLHEGSSPLHVAVNRGSCKIVSNLLVHGANLYARDARDMTPIHQLTMSKSYCGQLLLSSPNLRNSVTRCCKLHHLHVAAMIGDINAMKKLLKRPKRKVNVEARISCKKDRDYNPECPFSVECPKHFNGFTALHLAMQRKQFDAINLLIIEYGADIFAEKPDGSAPIYDALSESIHKGYFIELLKLNKDLQDYAKAHSGLTMLHLACYKLDKDWVKELLDKRYDVNAQMKAKSPIWKKYTPLHVLLILYGSDSGWNNRNDDIDTIFELLLDYDADVMLRNANLDTPLHVAFNHTSSSFPDEVRIWRVRMILHYLVNYRQNPVGSSGISHFHIACCFHDIYAIEQFLSQKKYVNQAADYFSNCPGYTMLHMALAGLSSWHCFTYKSLEETVRFLVESGADVNAEDSNGDTPLHLVAKSDFGFQKLRELFDILIAAGADFNAVNIRGETALEIVLREKMNSNKNVEFFCDHGCNLNKFNSITQIGCLATMFAMKTVGGCFSSTLSNLDAVTNKLYLTATDQYGRTAIHNIVSITESPNVIDGKTYAAYIKQLCDITGSDVDDQDNEGRTALHYATQFNNNRAVSALLEAGADVNIIDNNENSAFTCSLKPCSDSVNCQRQEKHFHEDVIKTFQSHVRKLIFLGLSINTSNTKSLKDSCSGIRHNIEWSMEWFKAVNDELTEAKKEKIDGTSLFLSDFLCDTRVIATYRLMCKSQRNEVDRFFRNSKLEKFREMESLFRLQYRKTVKKSKFIERERAALRILIGFTLPVPCENRILSFFTNVELGHLITLAIAIPTQC